LQTIVKKCQSENRISQNPFMGRKLLSTVDILLTVGT